MVKGVIFCLFFVSSVRHTDWRIIYKNSLDFTFVLVLFVCLTNILFFFCLFGNLNTRGKNVYVCVYVDV